jgi:hypothetical protein
MCGSIQTTWLAGAGTATQRDQERIRDFRSLNHGETHEDRTSQSATHQRRLLHQRCPQGRHPQQHGGTGSPTTRRPAPRHPRPLPSRRPNPAPHHRHAIGGGGVSPCPDAAIPTPLPSRKTWPCQYAVSRAVSLRGARGQGRRRAVPPPTSPCLLFADRRGRPAALDHARHRPGRGGVRTR